MTFCLVHGNWHDGSCWAPLAGLLEARGHTVVAPDLPIDDPRATWAERAAPAIDAVEGADDVVVVGHSAGSAEAALVAAARPVALVVHLCARLGTFPVPPGAPHNVRPTFPFPPKDADGTTVWEVEAAADALYPRFPRATALELARRLRAGAPAADDYPLAGHPDVPTALVYTVDDEIFEPAWEQFAAREMLGVEPIELPGGHFPMLEDPETLAELLDRLARRAKIG